jgi:hypothetical protein
MALSLSKTFEDSSTETKKIYELSQQSITKSNHQPELCIPGSLGDQFFAIKFLK